MKVQKLKFCIFGMLIVMLMKYLIPTAFALEDDNNQTTPYWYDEAMRYCNEMSLFDGIPKEYVDLNAQVTWAIIAQVFANRTENYQKEYYKISTDDEEANQWYDPAIKWMNGIGILDNKKFPESQISRESVVSLLFQYAYKTENETDFRITNSDSNFIDKETISDELKNAVNWAEEHGVIHGYLDSSFRPNQSILFSEMAQMFYNAKDFIKNTRITNLFSYSVTDIEKIEFQNGNTGEIVSYTSEDELKDIIEHLKAFKFESLEPASDGWTYRIRIWFKDKSDMHGIVLNPSSACFNEICYISSGHEYFPKEWIEQYIP